MQLPIRVITPAYLFTGKVESDESFLGWLNPQGLQTNR